MSSKNANKSEGIQIMLANDSYLDSKSVFIQQGLDESSDTTTYTNSWSKPAKIDSYEKALYGILIIKCC